MKRHSNIRMPIKSFLSLIIKLINLFILKVKLKLKSFFIILIKFGTRKISNNREIINTIKYLKYFFIK